MLATFTRIFFLHDVFQPDAGKTKKTFAFKMNERFEINVEVVVNEF